MLEFVFGKKSILTMRNWDRPVNNMVLSEMSAQQNVWKINTDRIYYEQGTGIGKF